MTERCEYRFLFSLLPVCESEISPVIIPSRVSVI